MCETKIPVLEIGLTLFSTSLKKGLIFIRISFKDKGSSKSNTINIKQLKNKYSQS